MKKTILFLVAVLGIAVMGQAAPKDTTIACGTTMKIKAVAKTGYHFTQWTDGNTDNPRSIEVKADASYYADFAPNIYRIVFLGDLGAELYVDSAAFGTTPVYGGATPTKPATAQYTYTFDGWNPNIKVVDGDQTYTATFSSVVNEYAIIFKNYDGAVLQNSNVAYGSMPEYKGQTPTKPATAQYTYTFKGWNNDIASVTGAATYVAQFDSVVNKYLVVFQNEGGAELYRDSVAYGTTPSYHGATPTKETTAQYTYTFDKWLPAVVAITGDATYTATFSSSVNSYTVSLSGVNCSVTGAGTYTYGTTVQISATANDCYHFTQWSDEDKNAARSITITGAVDLTATAEVNMHNVKIYSTDETKGEVEYVEEK